MHARSWASAYRGILPDAYLDHALQAERAAHWEARMREIGAGAGHVLIAEHGGEAVGFVCLVEPDETGSVLVDNLHAMPGRKGLGTGTAMLAEAIRWARSRGNCICPCWKRTPRPSVSTNRAAGNARRVKWIEWPASISFRCATSTRSTDAHRGTDRSITSHKFLSISIPVKN